MAVLFSSFVHFFLAVIWQRPGPQCLPAGHLPGERASQLSVLASCTPFFKELFNIFTHKRFVVMMCHNHQCFYRDTISRKAAFQDPNLAIRHGYPPPGANPIFEFLLLLLLSLLLSFILLVLLLSPTLF